MKLVTWNVNSLRSALKKGYEDEIATIPESCEETNLNSNVYPKMDSLKITCKALRGDARLPT